MRIKKILIAAMSVMFLSQATACAKAPKAEGFELSHFDGMNIDEYDSDLLWRNSAEIANDGSGDGDVMWVSEEEDPVNGGWFYMYSTKGGGVPSTADGKNPTKENGEAAYYPYVLTSRSRDMVDWEMCGAVDNCYSLKLGADTWVSSNMYAPECIRNQKDGKYYLYYTAASKVNDVELRRKGARYTSDTALNSRFYIGVAVSESPCGPFLPCTSENMYGGADKKNLNGYVLDEINPTILLDEECDELFYTNEFKASVDFEDRDEIFSIIDVSPFFDTNGDLYLYFCRHMSAKNPGGHTVWGVKMKDMVSPDYTTLTCMMRGTYTSSFTGTEMLGNKNASLGKKFVRTEYTGDPAKGVFDPDKPRHLGRSWASYSTYEDGTESDDGQSEYNLVEAPNMIQTKDKDGKTVYVCSYAMGGVDRTSGDYDCKAAYSYHPLEGFIKPNVEDGAYILGVDPSVNDFMSNLGHVSFVEVGEEIWIAHWQRQTPFGGLDQGRLYALSSCSMQYMENTGIYMPIANGPTTSLQPKTEAATGYKNVAKQAKITAKNGRGDTLKYLNDGMRVTRGEFADREFRAEKKDKTTEITLTFDTPVTVRGVLVYNSYSTNNAFKNISLIQFNLAETPLWHTGGETKCYIKNLPYNAAAYVTGMGNLQPGSAVVATFNEIKVNSITIFVQKSDLYNDQGELKISEIVVLGK